MYADIYSARAIHFPSNLLPYKAEPGNLSQGLLMILYIAILIYYPFTF